jgi:hypothetical protein
MMCGSDESQTVPSLAFLREGRPRWSNEEIAKQNAVKCLKTNGSVKAAISHPNDFKDLRGGSRRLFFRLGERFLSAAGASPARHGLKVGGRIGGRENPSGELGSRQPRGGSFSNSVA